MPLIGKLVVIKGPSKNMGCKISKGEEVTVGRNPQCNIPIPDVKLSRIHCIVRNIDNCFEVLDSKSTNGTFVNQQPALPSITLTSGDVIELGDSLIKFVYEEENASSVIEIDEIGPIDDKNEDNSLKNVSLEKQE